MADEATKKKEKKPKAPKEVGHIYDSSKKAHTQMDAPKSGTLKLRGPKGKGKGKKKKDS